MPRNKKPNRKHHNHKQSNGTATVPAHIRKTLATQPVAVVNGHDINSLLAAMSEEWHYPRHLRDDYAPALRDGRLIAFDRDAAVKLFGQPLDGAISEALHAQVFAGCQTREAVDDRWRVFLHSMIRGWARLSSESTWAVGEFFFHEGDEQIRIPIRMLNREWEDRFRFIVCQVEEDLATIYNQGQPRTPEYEARQARRTAKALAESLNETEEPAYTRRARV